MFTSLCNTGDWRRGYDFLDKNFFGKESNHRLIGTDYRVSCLNLLIAVLDSDALSDDDLAFLGKVIDWLDHPVDDFTFSFSVSCRANDHLEVYSISNDQESFRMEDIHHVYEEGVGGDTYSTFQYLVFSSGPKLEGNLSKFESSAIELIKAYGDSEMNVEITISDVVE